MWNLRSGRSFRRIGSSLEGACGRLGLRVVEYSVLGNHIHLIVEAESSEALSRGMQGLSIRIAKALNRMMKTRGRVFDDHYHAELLRSPTQLVRAIAYVLRNHEHHYAAAGTDPFSSDGLPEHRRTAELCVPVSWLLTAGWLRAPRQDRARLAGTRFSGA